MYRTFYFLLALVMLAACQPITPVSLTATPTIPAATATPTKIPATATPVATSTPESTPTTEKVIVTEGSEWAKYLPIGMKVRRVGEQTIATNALGEDIIIAENGVRVEWLTTTLAIDMASSVENEIPSYEEGPKILTMLGKINAKPFSEGTQSCKSGDIGKADVLNIMQELTWTHKNRNMPAQIIGFFTVKYDGKTVYGKVIEWLTNKGIVYISIINTERDFQTGNAQEILPIGLGYPGKTPKKTQQPNGSIIFGEKENKLLNDWVINGCPSVDAQNFFFVGRSSR